MKKKAFFPGSVFQFFIPEIQKYAFCKFFDFRHLSDFHGLIAQVFDKSSDSEINDINQLSICSPLFGFRSIHRWPNLRKDSGWKALGLLAGPSDDIVPDFKGTMSRPVEDESKIANWYAIYNFTESEHCEYNQIKHLERITLTTSSLGLVWRTGMEYCRIKGLSIEDHYDLGDDSIRNTYWQMINTPIFCDTAKELRSKAFTSRNGVTTK